MVSLFFLMIMLSFDWLSSLNQLLAASLKDVLPTAPIPKTEVEIAAAVKQAFNQYSKDMNTERPPGPQPDPRKGQGEYFPNTSRGGSRRRNCAFLSTISDPCLLSPHRETGL